MSFGEHYRFSPRATREFRRLDVSTRRRIVEALDRLVGDPPQGDVKKLRGTDDEWRLRVGDVRVRFTRDSDTGDVWILRVLPRGAAFRR